jgi:hypothetical protein
MSNGSDGLLATFPELTGAPMEITDQYLIGTRLRLREVTEGTSVTRKLGLAEPRGRLEWRVGWARTAK